MKSPGIELHNAGENALILYLGHEASATVSAAVQATAAALREALGPDLVDLVPSYASLLVIYNPLSTDHYSVSRRVLDVARHIDNSEHQSGSEVVLPVYYSPESGADLETLAAQRSLSVDEVIELHTAIEYRVYAIGFAPGFAYLGEVDPRIAAPRLATPRQRVPAGAVAIADRQTAVYPAPSPGGWNLLGRCPVPMFDPAASPCMPVAVGDRVRFEAISRDEYLRRGGSLT
jgi:KipI family sensor histidine kinase inhibitor